MLRHPCLTKRRYATRQEVEAALAGVRRRLRRAGDGEDADALKTYRCPLCSGWHIGHRRRSRRKAC